MKFRIIATIIAAMLLSSCYPKSLMLKHRDIRSIEAGLGIDSSEKIIPSDDKVDLLATKVAELLQDQGFELLNSSVSWGLQPLTGHTQNLGFRLLGENSVHCYVQISKKEFRVNFQELETKPHSNEFNTSSTDLAVVDKVVVLLNELAKQEFEGRTIRISEFNRTGSPNK